MNPTRLLAFAAGLTLLFPTACTNPDHAHSGHGAPTASVASNSQPDEASLLRASQEYDDVFAKMDVQRAEKLLADEYQLTDFNGRVTRKAEWLALARSGNGASNTSTSQSRQVRVYGNMGIVTGRWTEAGLAGAPGGTDVLQYSTVFIHRDGQWKVLLDHATRIANR